MGVDRTMKFTDLKDMLNKTEDMYSSRPAYKLRNGEKGKYKIITHKEYRDEIKALGTALIDLGLKNARIAVISENRYEWGVAYLAIATGTGIVVPLDKALPENEIESLITRSEVEAIFYSKKYDEIMNKIKNDKSTKLKYFISMDLQENDYENNIYSQKELTQKGKALIDSGNKEFIDAKIDNSNMGIMLFTSGTTSQSKAVMLSHTNLCTNVMDIRELFECDETDTFLSFLPLHHTFECTVGFLYPVSIGGCIVFCDGLKHIAENLKEYQITAMISVPILFENMYKRLMKTIEKQGKLDKVKKGIKISNFLLKFKIDIRKKLFKEIHDNLGGKLRIMVAGGAALDPEAQKGFYELGFNVLQGYGLTETSPVIAAELTHRRRFGSIGKKFLSLEVKIDEPDENGEGELMAKGPSVMLGYYNNEEKTKETLEPDGWIHTGDLARIDKDGYIFISGRKKDVIVLKNGKNIYPEELETLINKIEGIKESFVYGRPEDDGDYKICTKVVYDQEIVKEIYNVEDEQQIKDVLWAEIKKINKTMPPYKYIRDVVITQDSLIKTTTLKIKRHEEIKKVV